MFAWDVTAQESGLKLSVFLKSKLGDAHSARQIKSAIEHNACTINGRIERFATSFVGRGDRVEFKMVEAVKPALTGLLFQDAYLLASNKPAGISSEDPKLCPQPGAILLHRLDKDTTGVLLWAKDKETAAQMEELFKKRLIKKSYQAVVDGIPKDKAGHIENQLGRLHQYQGQSFWGPVDKGLIAITDWRLEKKLDKSALLFCFPQTGRTHQIRIHLSGLGHPILGDKQYGGRQASLWRPSRCLLHAYQVVFNHPQTGKPLTITAPIPDDFHEAFKALGGK